MSEPGGLAAAALEAYNLARAMCGKHNADRKADCEPYLVRGMTCVDCPMDIVGPIEDALQGRVIVPEVREWHGLDAEKAQFPPALADRIASWRRVLCVVRIAGEQEIWYATGIAGSECVGVVWQDGAEPEEYRMPLALFRRLKPWEIDWLRIPEN